MYLYAVLRDLFSDICCKLCSCIETKCGCIVHQLTWANCSFSARVKREPFDGPAPDARSKKYNKMCHSGIIDCMDCTGTTHANSHA